MIGTIEIIMMMTLMLWGVWTVKCYSDMSIIEKMRADFEGMNEVLFGPFGAGPEAIMAHTPDHWSLKFFNWMLQGNYDRYANEQYHERYLRQLREAAETLSYRRFRSIAINAFTTMLSLEYNCSYGYAQRCLIDVMGDARNLARLNQELIQYAVRYYNDRIGEKADYLIWFDFRKNEIVEWDDGGVG